MNSLVKRAASVISNEGVSGLAQKVIRKTKEAVTGKYDVHAAYDDDFFSFNLADSRPQAEWLAPRIAAVFNVKSVYDFGCATGHWIDAFLRAGVDARGFEGSPAAKNALVCPADRVTIGDLRYPLPDFNARADLAMSIEVAEHIEERFADNYLDNIVKCQPHTVLLTAAPPGQGGHHHVNEQPPAYWIAKMAARGYAIDERKADAVTGMIAQGYALVDVPPVMQHPTITHKGVWFPDWISKNLLVFSRY
jgi:SAM-dependent methyltransferase